MRPKKRGNLEPNRSSIVINILPVLETRNIKHPTAFLKRLGISPNSAAKILHGKASQINMNQLTKLCVALNCTPNDLFMLRDMDLSPKHQLNDLQKMRPVSDMMSVDEFLGKKSVVEVRGMLRR